MAEIKQKIKGNSLMLVALFLLVVALAGLFVFVLPKKDAHDSGQAQLLQKETELQRTKANLSRLNALESSFEGSEVTQRDLLNLIPEDIEQEVIIRTLAKAASDTEISINSMSFSLNQEQEIELTSLRVTVNIAGKHQSLVSFIEELEESGRKFNVKNISVQTLDNFQENMSLTFDAYSL